MNSNALKIKYIDIVLCAVLTMLVFTYFKKISIEVFSIYSIVEKVIPILCIGIVFAKNLINNYQVKSVLLLFMFFVFWGVFISLLNGKDLPLILYQIYHEMKYPTLFVIVCGISIKSKILCNYRFQIFLLLIFFLCFIDIIFREVSPAMYNSIYKDGGHLGRGDFGDYDVVRHAGIFWHSSQLAVFACLVFIYYVSEFRTSKRLYAALFCSLSMICLIFSMQRFELLCLFIVLFIYFMINLRIISVNYLPKMLSVILFFALLCTPYLIFLLEINLETFADIPRFVFYSRSYYEMVDSYFLGKGWGTLGSHAAADIAEAYNTIFWQQYWWIKEGLYSYDTFWPHIIAELGLPGVLLCISLLARMTNLFVSINAKLMFFFLVLTSLSSSNLQSFYYLLITLLLVIAAERRHYGDN